MNYMSLARYGLDVTIRPEYMSTSLKLEVITSCGCVASIKQDPVKDGSILQVYSHYMEVIKSYHAKSNLLEMSQ